MKGYQHMTCRKSKISIIILMLVYVLLFPLINATAQNIIQFEHLSIEQGLSQSTVTSIVEDHLGFIWFGTEEGLNKYDGYGFTVYKPKLQNRDSLLGKNITSLLHDSTKTLWVGTRNGGISKYDYKTDTFTTFYKESNNPKTISSSSVFQVYEDRTGTIWVVTRDAGL
ncbi:MAG: histidine kinase, partial [Blastocatellia bacterium]|nr:histidine kinase [Blastocatellia bacterium]